MGENHTLDVEAIAIACELRIVHVEAQMLGFEIGAFAKQEVGARAEIDQLVVPSRVARENESFSIADDLYRKGNIRLGMRTPNGAELKSDQLDALAGLEDDPLNLAL